MRYSRNRANRSDAKEPEWPVKRPTVKDVTGSLSSGIEVGSYQTPDLGPLDMQTMAPTNQAVHPSSGAAVHAEAGGVFWCQATPRPHARAVKKDQRTPSAGLSE